MALATRPKKPTHHRKRQAHHHKKSKGYVKAYLPYLPMLAVIATGVLLHIKFNNPASVLGSISNFSHEALLMETNEVRSSNHKPALLLNPQLSAAAQAKADDLVAHDYWAHTSPNGQTPWSLITASGYQYRIAGENLAFGFRSADQVITGWLNSQEHRDNLLSNNYQDVGFGIASSPNFMGKGPQVIIVAEYGAPSAAAAHIQFTVNNPEQAVKGESVELPSKRVAAIQILTDGRAAWSLMALSAIAGGAVTLFILRHGYRIHKAINRGELFIVHHPWLDLCIVVIATVCLLLTQTSGFIR